MSLDSQMESFLADFNGRPWKQNGAPSTLTPHHIYPANPGVQIEVAYATARGRPSANDARSLWSDRWNKRSTGVLLVASYPGEGASPKAAVVGLRDKSTFVTDLSFSSVERIVDQALEAPTTARAEEILASLFEEHKEDEIPGLANTGLFATHELLANVPHRRDWPAAGARAQAFRGHGGEDLVRALGWDIAHQGMDVLLKKDGQGEAVAVFLQGDELFDRPATRFGTVSPVQHAIAAARNARLRWVLAVQGTRMRLYTADPDTGVARKGSDTYTEINLATIDDEHAAYATLLMTPEALCEGGTADEILGRSMDHATALGERLRERVYVDVVPDLATAVAQQLKATTEAELREAYHITLVVLFRLLFVAYAEDRGLLPYRTNDAYTQVSLKARARYYASHIHDGSELQFDPHAEDLWGTLLNIWHGVYAGHTEWGIPAYGGSLFDPQGEAGATISGMRLTDAQVGPALVKLLVDTGRDATEGPVDFQTLSVREFGTIYEGLLESSLSIAPSNLTLDDKGTYVPAKFGGRVVVPIGQVYFHNASGKRKATGSYFTKQFAVEHLLETALDPTVEEHLAQVAALLDVGDEAEAHTKFWDFRVADISMGSGHFLVGAVDHIASAFTAFLSKHPIPGVLAELDKLRTTAIEKVSESKVDLIPEIDQMTLVRRQIAKRCIYGVDVNAVAVDLARLGLWIHTFVPGLPMSSLNHGLIQGNSLTGIGTLEEAFEVLEPTRKGMHSFLAERLEDLLQESAQQLHRVGLMSEATADESREAAEVYAEAVRRSEPARAILDAAVAVRLGLVSLDEVFDVETILQAGRRVDVQAKMHSLGALHFVQAFPEVFLRRVGGGTGFHVILGNPPWEKTHVEEHNFWSIRFPGLKGMPEEKLNKAIQEYRQCRPDLVVEYEAECSAADLIRNTIVSSKYPGVGTGHVDLFQIFCWRTWRLLREKGRAGLMLPRGATSGSGVAEWRSEVLSMGAFEDVSFLMNDSYWVFEGVDNRLRCSLTTFSKKIAVPFASFRGPYRNASEYRARGAGLVVQADDFKSWSEGAVFPMFPSPGSQEIFQKLRSHPRFDSAEEFWFYPVQGDFNTTTHKNLWKKSSFPGAIPVLAGASYNLWDPDYGDPFGWAAEDEIMAALKAKRLKQIRRSRSAYSGFDIKSAIDLPARISFRDRTNLTNTRSTLVALVPPRIVLVHNAPFLVRRAGTAADEAYVLGVMSSTPFDWYIRRWVDRHLTFDLLRPAPLPRPCIDSQFRARVVEISARLAAVDERYADWAREVGVPVGSATDQGIKNSLICELDAVVAHLYGLTREELIHIYATFHRGWDYQSRLDAALEHFDRWDYQ